MPDELLLAVREILFREWDPIGVNRVEQCVDEYDCYAPKICKLLREGAGEYKLASYLRHLQSDSMGMLHVDEELHNAIAKRLVDLLH
jgi:hypothetical protein